MSRDDEGLSGVVTPPIASEVGNPPRKFIAARVPNLDYLRLFLALEVLAQHLWIAAPSESARWNLLPPVATFVCISGFLLPRSLQASRSLAHFAWKRALRTLPALFVLFAAIAVLVDMDHLLGAVTQYLTAGFAGDYDGSILPLWSLGVEDGLYIVIAVLFLFRVHQSIATVSTTVASLLVADFFIVDPLISYRVLSLSAAFFAGALLRAMPDRWPPLPVALAGIIAVASGTLDGFGSLYTTLGAICAVIAAVRLPQLPSGLPDFSYGIYIWHGPVLLYLLGLGIPRDSSWALATVCLTLSLAVCSWFLVEAPALRLRN